MTIPYAEPLTPLELGPRVVPEPPRKGDPGGEPCRVCTGGTTSAGVVERPLHAAPTSRLLTARHRVAGLGRARRLLRRSPAGGGSGVRPDCRRRGTRILARGGVGRVHLYRWGDGGAHFHVWLMPRPLGMLQACGAMLPLWEDVLPNVPDENLARAAEEIAARLA